MKDWDTLRYVLAVAREGGLSGAARALGVNHATVSRQLDRAETLAGTRLFDRRATGLVPTEAGREAADRASAIEAEVLALDLALAARDERATGKLTVSLPPLMASSGIADDIAAFRSAFPAVELTILGDNALHDIHRRETDVAIRVSREPSESLWGRVVSQQRAGWFASPAYLAEHRNALTSGGAVPLIAFTGWANPVPKSVAATFPGAEVATRSDDMISAVAMAQSGIGMVRMPNFLGQITPGLERVPGLDLVDYSPIWCLTHPDLRRVPRIAEFMRVVGEGFSSRRSLYLGDAPLP